MIRSLVGAVAGLLLAMPACQAAALSFGIDDAPPPIVLDTTKPRLCTIGWLVADTATNDLFLARMQVAPALNEKPAGGSLPCPTEVPPRMAARALDVCLARATDAKTCVFGDMTRGFLDRPDVRNSAENGSRCASDLYRYIGIACWRSGDINVCNVGCGRTDLEARGTAQGRCESKHQKSCTITGSSEILAPQ